jgi:hypothetical protein
MKTDQPDWRIVLPEIARAPHVQAGAGIYLHQGSTHLVGHHSAAEEALLDAGALLVAVVRFDQSAADAGRRTGQLNRVDARSVTRYPPVPSRN